MSQELISKKTRNVLREYLVDLGRSARIGMEFDSADVPLAMTSCPKTTGERRTLVEQYYHSLDFTSAVDTKKFLRVCEGRLNRLDKLTELPTEWNKCPTGMPGNSCSVALAGRVRLPGRASGRRQWHWSDSPTCRRPP